jgi:hypothetical protein
VNIPFEVIYIRIYSEVMTEETVVSAGISLTEVC